MPAPVCEIWWICQSIPELHIVFPASWHANRHTNAHMQCQFHYSLDLDGWSTNPKHLQILWTCMTACTLSSAAQLAEDPTRRGVPTTEPVNIKWICQWFFHDVQQNQATYHHPLFSMCATRSFTKDNTYITPKESSNEEWLSIRRLFVSLEMTSRRNPRASQWRQRLI